jgi:hypothetical protein
LFLLLSVEYLKLCIVSYVILLHPLRDARFEIPANTQGLIASKVDIAIRECSIDILHDLVDEIISGFECWVELASVDKVASDDILVVFLAATP